jgi:hypothetical protein
MYPNRIFPWRTTAPSICHLLLATPWGPARPWPTAAQPSPQGGGGVGEGALDGVGEGALDGAGEGTMDDVREGAMTASGELQPWETNSFRFVHCLYGC